MEFRTKLVGGVTGKNPAVVCSSSAFVQGPLGYENFGTSAGDTDGAKGGIMQRLPASILTWARTTIRSDKVVVPLGAVGVLLITAPVAWAQYGHAPAYDEPGLGAILGDRVVRLLTGFALGLVVGMVMSPAFARLRYFLFVRLRPYVIGAAVLGFCVFEVIGPYQWAELLSYVVAFGLGVFAFGAAYRLGEKIGQSQTPRPTSFGSAKWADLAHLLAHDMIGTDGFALGEFRAGDETKPLRYSGTRHLLTVAPTRAGKGVSSIIPNLLSYEGSVVVIDPKGENALITALRRGPGSPDQGITGLRQKVFLMDPWDIAASRLGWKAACFNPLDWISGDDPDAAENAFILADALVPTTESEGEARFWDEEAKALLTGVILYVATAPDEAEHRHLGRVRDILVQGDEDLKATLTAMYNHHLPIVSTTASRTASKEPKLRGSVIASVQAHTHFLDSPRIRESLSRSDFHFEKLKTESISVFLILPADRLKTFDRWLRLLVQQAITVNARNIGKKPERPILFLLDEMAALGRLSKVEEAFGLMAGFGMQLWGIVQDLSQLARIYGETGWQTFISNSGVIQYFGSRDKMTAEYFSTLCGVTTVKAENESWSFGRMIGISSTSSPGGSSSGSSSSDSWTRTTGRNESQRQLAYPDELMVLKAHDQIVFIENLDPVAARKVQWFEHPRFRRLGVSLHGPIVELEPETPALPPPPPEIKDELKAALHEIIEALRAHPITIFIQSKRKTRR